MILESLRSARFALLEDSLDVNVLPLLQNVLHHISKDVKIIVLCYEQPAAAWRNILTHSDVEYHEKPSLEVLCNISYKCLVMIDSFNQMSLQIGMQPSVECLRALILNPIVVKIITVFHTDCIQKSVKTLVQLEHLAQLTLSLHHLPDESKLRVTMNYKKGGKFVKATEDIWYDSEHGCLRSSPLTNEQLQREDKVEVLPHTLTTFKIGLEDNEKVARNELELPYLKKNETGRVHYEHDAADDWDDEDPDEDLDI